MSPAIKNIFLTIISSLLLILSFPKFDLGFLAWIALVPLLMTLKNTSIKRAFILSYINGMSFLMGVYYYWINVISGFSFIEFLLLGTYYGFYFAVFGTIYNYVNSKKTVPSIVSAPLLWVSMEYLRSNIGFMGIPFALLGHSQYLNLPVIQISSYTGVYGVSFLIVMANTALSEIMLYFLHHTERVPEKPVVSGTHYSFPLMPSLITLAILGICLAWGRSVLLKDDSNDDNIRVTVIQGNIPQDIKWKPELKHIHLNKYIRLTNEALNGEDSSLVVWPETSVQGVLLQEFRLLKTITGLAKSTKTHLLFGSSQRPKYGTREFNHKSRLNSAFLVSPKGLIAGQYNKMHLLPFGEYIPYKNVFPWPSRYNITNMSNFVRGTEHTILNADGINFGVSICWESIFPDFFRQFVKRGAKFMINMTNEAWFGETASPYQIMAMNVFRAVENRTSIARSANTGISCFINPYGKIIGRVKNGNKDIFIEGYLTKTIPVLQKQTFYTLHGNIFVYICIGISLFILILSLYNFKSHITNSYER